MWPDPRRAAGRANTCSQNADSSGFARAIGSKKAEDLSGRNVKINAIEGYDLRFRFFLTPTVILRIDGSPGGSGWLRVVNLAEIAGTNG